MYSVEQIEAMSELEFAEFFRDLRNLILEDPIEWFIKSPIMIDFEPTPAQMVALKCMFGIKLDRLKKYQIHAETVDEDDEFDLLLRDMTEIEIYEYMTGFIYDPRDLEIHKNRINFIIGRRGGKSTLASILAVYSMFKVNWKPFLKKTPVATIAILSHSVDFSQEVLEIIRGMIEDSPILTRLINKERKNTQSTFHVSVPFLQEDGLTIQYSEVAVKVGAASKKTTRGRAICTLLMDEIAFWNLDENAAESDADVIRAVTPSLAQFEPHGMMIKLSSPAIKQGVLYDEWMKKEILKNEYLQFKAPSWVWNTILPKEFFRKEYKKDSNGFDTEYRANFVDSISNFITPDFVDQCVMKGVTVLPPSTDRRVKYTAAIDAAFKSDRFTFNLVGHNETRISSYVTKSWEGTKKNPIKAYEVAQFIRNICNQYGVQEVVADQYSFQPLREIFEQFGIVLIENTFTITFKKKIYFALRRVIHSHNLDLLDVPLLAKEIKELQVEQTPTGQIKIGHPVGGSDDLADSLAVAVYGAIEKSNLGGMILSDMAPMDTRGVKTDLAGKAFTAPAPSMLQEYKGFQGVIDNSSEYAKDPKTGKMVHKSLIEQDEEDDDEGGSFTFA